MSRTKLRNPENFSPEGRQLFERLVRLRKSRGVDQAGLARALRVSQALVWKWEADRGFPSGEGYAKLAQLAEDRLSASFIADGIHVPPFALRALLRAKGLARTILVTDATAAAAAPAGHYALAGMAIERAADGAVRVPGASVLAGSSLELDQAMRNVVAWGIATAEEAVGLASANPRALLAPALAAHRVRLAEGVVEWSPELRPVSVRADGVAWRAADGNETSRG